MKLCRGFWSIYLKTFNINISNKYFNFWQTMAHIVNFIVIYWTDTAP
jgi:hypothetical protein